MNLAVRTILLAMLCAVTGSAWAVPFEFIRIGDQDGFGYGDGGAFNGADGAAADRGGVAGLLDPGDLLPDINGDGIVATTFQTATGGFVGFDEFDNRLGEGLNCVGCTNQATTGVEFTDISLATSYDARSAAGAIYDANTDTFGTGGAFPVADSFPPPIQPGFLFDFFVADTDIALGQDIFFNLVFADYDVVPAEIVFTRADGSTFVQALVTQDGTADGLIQAAFATLAFNDVFTSVLGGFNGRIAVDFDAPQEPYTAFDFVELSVEPISITVPEPGTFSLLLFALLGLRAFRRGR